MECITTAWMEETMMNYGFDHARFEFDFYGLGYLIASADPGFTECDELDPRSRLTTPGDRSTCMTEDVDERRSLLSSD